MKSFIIQGPTRNRMQNTWSFLSRLPGGLQAGLFGTASDDESRS
jgi:hypothetical protein